MAARSNWMRWVGIVLSVVPSLLMLFSGVMKLTHNPGVVEAFAGKFGYRGESTLTVIGLLEVGCVVVYAIPRTMVLGAILMTGYLGGAVATHVRIGDPSFVMPFLLGVFAWGGLYLRDARIRALLPLTPPNAD
ncbi:MAG TPA: DoxX family protein [Polyangiaceae bacterium]